MLGKTKILLLLLFFVVLGCTNTAPETTTLGLEANLSFYLENEKSVDSRSVLESHAAKAHFTQNSKFTEIAIGEGDSCENLEWRPLSSFHEILFSPGNGEKKLSYRYRADKFTFPCQTRTVFIEVPTPAPALALAASNPSPSTNNSAVLTISNVNEGSLVRIYSDANCTIPVAQTNISAVNPAPLDFTLPTLMVEGIYDFYGQTVPAAGPPSPCSAAVRYEYDITPPLISFEIPNPAQTNALHNIVLTLHYAGASALSAPLSSFLTFSGDSAGCSITVSSISTTEASLVIGGCSSGGGSINLQVAAGSATDAAGNTAGTALSNPILIDNTPPSKPNFVSPPAYSRGNQRTPAYAWTTATDAGVGNISYEVAIGTTSGGSNISPWSSVGNTLSYPGTSIALTSGTQYYTSIRSVDGLGNTSPSTSILWTAAMRGVPFANSPTGIVYASALQNVGGDLLRLVGGDFSQLETPNSSANLFIKLTNTGARDISFDVGSGVYGSAIYKTIRQNDGKILIAGAFTKYRDQSATQLTRINADGTLDTAFNNVISTKINGAINDMALDSQGRIVIIGSFSTVHGASSPRIARLLPDGTRDASFVLPATSFTKTSSTPSLNTLTINNTDQVYVGGDFDGFDGNVVSNLARLTTTGNLDVTFTTQTFSAPVSKISILGSGNIAVGGSFEQYNNLNAKYFVILNSSGAVASNFVLNSLNLTGFVYSILEEPGDQILLGGANFIASGKVYLTRIKLDIPTNRYLIENGFTLSGYTGSISGTTYDIAKKTDGKIILAGTFRLGSLGQFNLLQLDNNGLLTPLENIGSGLNMASRSVSIDGSNNLFVGGHFTTFQGAPKKYLARYQATGSPDASFNTTTTPAPIYQTVRAIRSLADGSVLIGGHFCTLDGSPRNYLAKLDSTGALVDGFNANIISSGAYYMVNSIVPAPDGKFYIGGSYPSVSSSSQKYLMRIDGITGQVDPAFNFFGSYFTNGGEAPAVNAIGVLSNSWVIVGGAFKAFQSYPQGNITKFDPGGGIDPSFGGSSGFDGIVTTIAVQSGDKILVGGNNLYRYKGITLSSPHLVRLNADGSLDNDFLTNFAGAGPNGPVNSIEIQSDGKILIAGSFASFSGKNRYGVVRLNADGTLDPTVHSGAEINHPVYIASQNPDESIFVGGPYTVLSGLIRSIGTLFFSSF